MPHQTITAALLSAGHISGSHPGPAYYAEWIIVVGAVIALPIYAVRRLRNRRNRGDRR
ncbi:hypothetical protein ACIRVK_42490 [Streptomyces sp. NPDC101152]|uniref:hypothetical protein n=1 Tax=Streptomyces sp. NPDC101152 TaxID=3366116 RepID=UPI0038151901